MMPRVYDMSKIDWPEDADEDYWPTPKPSDFEYMTPNEMGGRREPVRFSIADGRAEGTDALTKWLEEHDRSASKPSAGTIGWLLGKLGIGGTGRAENSPAESAADWHRQEDAREAEWAIKILTHVLPLLTDKLGAVRLYGRYDGGNDEGFAWLSHIEIRDGHKMNRDEVVAALTAAGAIDQLKSADLIREPTAGSPEWLTEARQLGDLIDLEFTGLFATWLLGRSYGTGEYMMYGAFTVDFDAQSITEDPNPDPVVRNIYLDLNG